MNEAQGNPRGSRTPCTVWAWLVIFVVIVVVMAVVGLITNAPNTPPYPVMVLLFATAGSSLLVGVLLLVRWLYCWRNVRRALITLAVIATLVAAFYTEENWRGRRAWEQCKRDLAAQGYVLDWNTLIPPAVPDDQNIYKAPQMQSWFVKASFGDLGKTGAQGTLEQRLINTNTVATITNRAVALRYLTWSDQHAAELEAIREALERPLVRIDCDYREPYRMAIPNFIALRNVAQVLAQRARCHLLLDQPAAAVRDLTLMFDSLRFLDNRPLTLVATMINVAITGLYLEVVTEGIQHHAWPNPELNVIQSQLALIKLPSLMPETFRMAFAASSYTWANHRQAVLELWFSEKRGWKEYFDGRNLFFRFAPQGWFDQNLILYSSFMKRMIETSEAPGRFFRPGRIEDVIADFNELDRRYFKPYTVLSTIGIPNYSKASQTAARTQTKADQALIVLALEKYHLAHNQYPETLDALAPQFITKLPHDVINGQPLKYRRTDDGSFVLYSVGWNETDDGGFVPLKEDGKTVNGREEGKPVNLTEGDWVWSYPAK